MEWEDQVVRGGEVDEGENTERERVKIKGSLRGSMES